MAMLLANRVAGASRFVGAPAPRHSLRTQNGSVTCMAASRPMWLPGSDPPSYLDGTLPGDFGWDPLGLGANSERLKWFAEAERVHSRWAMLAVAGILAQEIFRPDIFWYSAPTQIQLPFNIVGLVAFELFAMHWVESKRGLDLKNPNSQNQDPIFTNYKLPDHEPGYPGGIFDPFNFSKGNLAELQLKEIKNGRLAMLAFVGFTMAAQVTGLNPLAALREHISDPINTTIFSKAAIIPTQAIAPACKIPSSVQFEGITIPTPCMLSGLWP